MTISEAVPERGQVAVIIDLDRCIGCWACAVACKMKNDLPEGVWWLRVDSLRGSERDDTGENLPDLRTYYMPVIERCAYSSAQAARRILPDCVKACPVDAMRFGERDRADSRIDSALRSPNAIHASNPPGSAFSVTYLPARAQKRQRRSAYLAPS